MKRTKLIIALPIFISIIAVLLFVIPSGGTKPSVLRNEIPVVLTEKVEDEIEALYHEMELEGVVNYDAFRQGVTGFNRIESKNKDILALVDFSRPSTEERLFIFDLAKKKTLYITHVSHGKNSGDNYATSFSNVNGSYQSSLGFYLTENTYHGKNGYSLRLEGLEAGINDLAKERAIVVHGASYSNPSVIASNGRLGRSMGCPAIPEELARPIIDTIKDGAVLFIFANHSDYPTQSSVIS